MFCFGRKFREGFSLEKIRVERANVDTPLLRAEKLEKLVSKEQLIGKLIAFLKHPWKMVKKYLSYYRKDRRIVFNFLKKNIKESFKKK